VETVKWSVAARDEWRRSGGIVEAQRILWWGNVSVCYCTVGYMLSYVLTNLQNAYYWTLNECEPQGKPWPLGWQWCVNVGSSTAVDVPLCYRQWDVYTSLGTGRRVGCKLSVFSAQFCCDTKKCSRNKIY
jgi:hypothetical protein